MVVFLLFVCEENNIAKYSRLHGKKLFGNIHPSHSTQRHGITNSRNFARRIVARKAPWIPSHENFLHPVCVFSRNKADLSTTEAEVACAIQWRASRPKATNCYLLRVASSLLRPTRFRYRCHQEGLFRVVLSGDATRTRPLEKGE